MYINSETIIQIIGRAKELADLKLIELRLDHPDADGESRNAALQATKGMSRGELIEAILLEEFS